MCNLLHILFYFLILYLCYIKYVQSRIYYPWIFWIISAGLNIAAYFLLTILKKPVHNYDNYHYLPIVKYFYKNNFM